MESDDKPWRHGMGRRGQKRGKRADSQPDITDALCNAALDYQKSVGFQHHSASIPTHFSGPPTLLQRKRLHGARSPTPGASASSPGRSRAGSPTDSLFKDQELDKDVIRGNRKSSVQLSGEDMELDDPSISTKIGRYRAWHPEDSFVTEVHPVLPPIFPTLEEMQAQYKPPLRRLRSRLDGFGGAVLFQHPEEAPPGVEAAIAKVIPLPKGCMETCDFPDRGRWNVILEGQQKKSLKRPLTAAASTSSSTKSDTGTADAEGATKKRKEEERPDPRVDLVLDYIKTGDDCVRFFMENEGRNRVKVFYCNRAKTAKAYQPYDMVVVPRAKIEDEHFSFSFDGVVHVETRIGTTCTTVCSHNKKMLLCLLSVKGIHSGKIEYCKARCRHNSASVVHENAYASDEHHCFLPPEQYPDEGPERGDADFGDLTIVIARQGLSCDSACSERAKVCKLNTLSALNKCTVLKKYLNCKEECIGSTGTDQPSEVVKNAPRHMHPGSCMYSMQKIPFSCQGSHPFTRRLCPCSAGLVHAT